MVYDFGLRLKELRQKKGLTQKQVAKILHVSSKSISGYEHNIVPPSIDSLKSLALLYGVTTDYLLGLNQHRSVVINCKTQEQELLIEKMIDLLQSEFNK